MKQLACTHAHTHTHEQQKHTLYSMANTFCSRDQLAPIILLLMPFLSHSSIVVLSYSLLGKHHSFRSFPFILTLGVKNARSGHLFNFVNSINIQYFLRNGFYIIIALRLYTRSSRHCIMYTQYVFGRHSCA